ncbi:MAG TPA: hypothetical protein VGL82_20675 [Bryobacteraceae bacterium]|jgi:uncharacterized protein (TIGR03437 family)
MSCPRKSIHIAGLMFALATVVSAQVGTVENAALYQPPNVMESVGILGSGSIFAFSSFLAIVPGLSANIIAPRMLAVLTYAAPQVIATLGPFPPAASVAATLFLRPVGSNSATPLTVTNAVSGAITFVVPSNFPLGGAELLYQIDNQPTQWTSVNVVPSSFEFFRISPGGPAIVQVPGAEGSAGNVGLATPVQPGQTVLLTGSGLGNGSTVSATIGGVPATVTYAGAYPAQLGRDEVFLQVPSGVPDGCYVPVTFTYNTTTVTTTISKTSDGSPCKHSWQLSVNDMKTLDNGGTIASGVVNFSSQLNAVTSAIASRSESANMSLSRISAGGIASYFTPAPAVSGPSCTAATPGTVGAIAVLNGIFSVSQPVSAPPDLGSMITLKSSTAAIPLTGEAPGGYYFSQNLPQPADGSLNNLPTSIPGGQWTWQSSGGKDLAASSFGFTLPAPIQLNGNAPISMRRDRDQTITWNGSAFDAGAMVSIYVNGTTALVSCTAPANSGSVTIPTSLLSGYTANTIGTLTADLNESGSFLPHAQFQLQNGSTLLMIVSFSGNDSRAVAFQ